jgi:hypothetical protein
MQRHMVVLHHHECACYMLKFTFRLSRSLNDADIKWICTSFDLRSGCSPVPRATVTAHPAAAQRSSRTSAVKRGAF